jgi:hypothetical protein
MSSTASQAVATGSTEFARRERGQQGTEFCLVLDQRLAPVVDRLHAEHLVIAGVLERVDAALVALVTLPAKGMSDLRSAVDLLTDSLLSHLSYEEGELVEPLGRLGPALYS